MEIRILASGSSGNAYYVSDGQCPLLLEAGISFKEIQRVLGFGVSGLAGCLISHEHGDHSKAVKDVMKAGVDCYMSKGTAEATSINGHRAILIEAHKQFTIGTWTILPFDTIHDAEEPMGYLMASRSGTKVLYATDTAYIKYRFHGLTHILIECNHSLSILRESVASGAFPQAHKNRVMRSHMSLETLCDFLKANDLSKVEQIWLLHLSESNSDAEGFKRRVQEISGKVVCYA